MHFLLKANNRRGFTLVEILAVLVLLGFIMAIVVPKIQGNIEEGNINSTKIAIQSLAGPLQDFKRNCGRFPSTEEGLKALETKPNSQPECKRYRPGGYLDGQSIAQDAWQQSFSYSSPDAGRTYIIKSLGADGADGGDGVNADITNKDI
jgi:general secretion pathway protein G